jgi:hypothetical protein
LKHLDQPNTMASFRSYHVDQIVADIKESVCRVSDAFFDPRENANIPMVSYEVRPPSPRSCWARWWPFRSVVTGCTVKPKLGLSAKSCWGHQTWFLLLFFELGGYSGVLSWFPAAPI